MPEQSLAFVVDLIDSLGTPFSYKVACHLRRGEWVEALSLSPQHPRFYTCDQTFALDQLAASLLKKIDNVPNGPTSEARVAKAKEEFFLSEADCLRTNGRLRPYLDNRPVGATEVGVMNFINSWRKELRRLLGRLPATLVPRFSGGSTQSDKGLLTTIPDKLSSKPSCYPETVCLLSNSFYTTAWGSLHRDYPPDISRANRFFTVPKQWDKDRGCCVEASVNVTLQLAVGQHLRKALNRMGINLETGKQTHQLLAQGGSEDGSLATIDMSRASDTVAKRLVQLVLPTDWYLLLNSLRAPFTEIDGRLVYLEKFSSMGNGFTFELETLLFGSLARVVQGPDALFSAFGDDLVVESQYAQSVINALEFFGFTPNRKKTFTEGPFRESCGGDFFKGRSVRGVYLKVTPREPQHWIAAANKLHAWGRNIGPYAYIAKARQACLSMIPSDIRLCRGPSDLGDTVIHEDDPSKWSYRPGNRHTPFLRAYIPVGTVVGWSHFKPEVKLVSAVLGCSSRGVSPRDSVRGYRLTWLPLGFKALPGDGDLFLESIYKRLACQLS